MARQQLPRGRVRQFWYYATLDWGRDDWLMLLVIIPALALTATSLSVLIIALLTLPH